MGRMARAHLSLLLLGLALAGCAGPRPPEELGGLWSAGPAACAAGVGVRFKADAIEAVYDREVETLFANPRYQIEGIGDAFRVRVTYDLPQVAGAAQVAGAHGVLLLARQPDGSIAPMAHSLVDRRTGAAHVRISNDPANVLMTLEPCGAHPWREQLRGREQT